MATKKMTREEALKRRSAAKATKKAMVEKMGKTSKLDAYLNLWFTIQ